MSTQAIPFSVNEALPASVRSAMDPIAQTIFRTTLNANLDVGKSELIAFVKAYRMLEEAGYEQQGDEWVEKDATLTDVHVDAPLGSRKKKGKKRGNFDVLSINSSLHKADTVAFDVPLFIRLLEMAREEIKSDEPLHVLTEKITALMKDRPTLTMDDYDDIVSVLKGEIEVAKRISGNSPIALNAKGQALA